MVFMHLASTNVDFKWSKLQHTVRCGLRLGIRKDSYQIKANIPVPLFVHSHCEVGADD